MHASIVFTIALITAALSIGGLLPGATVVAALLAVAVATLGVPHGGLDHWTGRRLVQSVASPTLQRCWPLVFFPAYAMVAVAVVITWQLFPIATLVAFVVLSARHFAIEDDFNTTGLFGTIAAIGWGGLVIWIPAWCRGAEMHSMLGMVMPMLSETELTTALTSLRCIGWCAIAALVAWSILHRGTPRTGDRLLSACVWVLLFATTPIPISFGIYFCGWHSIRGLHRLRSEHGQTWPGLIVAVAPLSLIATAAIMVGGMTLVRGTVIDAAIVQTLFIGLSAIAVPHMVLHEPAWANLSRFVSRFKTRIIEVAS